MNKRMLLLQREPVEPCQQGAAQQVHPEGQHVYQKRKKRKNHSLPFKGNIFFPWIFRVSMERNTQNYAFLIFWNGSHPFPIGSSEKSTAKQKCCPVFSCLFLFSSCWSQYWWKYLGLTWCLLTSLAGATLEYIPHGQLANTHLTSSLRTLKLEQDSVSAPEERTTPLVEAVRGRKSFPSQDKTLTPINLTDDQLASGLYGNNWLIFTFHHASGVWI